MENRKRDVFLVIAMCISTLCTNVILGQSSPASGLTVSTDFESGGGTIEIIRSNPPTIRIEPHNEGPGGWGQVWWYFMVNGLTPGEEIVLQLDNRPGSAGISPQIFFSYDQEVWGLTSTGETATIDGRDLFIYKHIVRDEKVWFSYDLPYTPRHMETLLLPMAERDPGVEVFELCRTSGGRPVRALRIHDTGNDKNARYGIWLQARTHAFESGGSWVLHGLAKWLFSGDPGARALRSCAVITIVPIVDVDGVVEGRTGKNQAPYDHNRGWNEVPSHWSEVNAIRSMISDLAKTNRLDFFMDFHGPGGLSHPYFIIPFSKDLPYAKQRRNREKFFDILNSEPLDEQAKTTQSMTQIHYSERPWDRTISSSREWVIMNTNEHSISLTIEVNMNTPLSTHSGYQAEGVVLGKAIADYFAYNHHQK